MVYDGLMCFDFSGFSSLSELPETQARKHCEKSGGRNDESLSDLMDRNMNLQMQLDQERKRREVETRKLQLVSQAREESMQRQLEEFQQSLESLQARFEYDLHFDILNEMPHEKAIRLCSFVEHLEKERLTIRERYEQIAAENEKLFTKAANKLQTQSNMRACVGTSRRNVKAVSLDLEDQLSPERTSLAYQLVDPFKIDAEGEEAPERSTAANEVEHFLLNTARGERPEQTVPDAVEDFDEGESCEKANPMIEEVYSCEVGDTQMYGCCVTLSDSSGATVTHPLFRLSITTDRWSTLRIMAQETESQLEDVEGFTWAITEVLNAANLSEFAAIYDLRLLSVPSTEVVLAIAGWCQENEHRFKGRLQATAVILPDSYWMSAIHGCVWMVTYIAPPVCPFQIVYSLEDAEAFLENSFQNATADRLSTRYGGG